MILIIETKFLRIHLDINTKQDFSYDIIDICVLKCFLKMKIKKKLKTKFEAPVTRVCYVNYSSQDDDQEVVNSHNANCYVEYALNAV